MEKYEEICGEEKCVEILGKYEEICGRRVRICGKYAEMSSQVRSTELNEVTVVNRGVGLGISQDPFLPYYFILLNQKFT